MSPRLPVRRPSPAAVAFSTRLASDFGQAVADERRRRGWAMRELAARARISPATVVGVEAGRPTSIDVIGRLAVILGIRFELVSGPSRRPVRDRSDVVHSAMGEYEAVRLTRYEFEVAIDHPYQHYQFAGRAVVPAWRRQPAAILHIENRTRLPDLQEIAGSFNAKCQYLAPVVARQIWSPGFVSQTHVVVALWSAEVIHALRLRLASVRALAPDGIESLAAWLRGEPPPAGTTRSLVLLDPFATGGRIRSPALTPR